MILTIIQSVTFVTYVVFLLIKFKGVLPSISDSWYELGLPLRRLFYLFCFILGIAMLFQGGGVIWFFISGSALSFVGMATAFKRPNSPTWIVHGAAAGIGIIFALLGIGIIGGFWLPLIIFTPIAVLMKLLKINNYLWWIEIAAFVFILFGLIITKL